MIDKGTHVRFLFAYVIEQYMFPVSSHLFLILDLS